MKQIMIFTSVFFFVIVIGSIILIKLYVPEVTTASGTADFFSRD